MLRSHVDDVTAELFQQVDCCLVAATRLSQLCSHVYICCSVEAPVEIYIYIFAQLTTSQIPVAVDAVCESLLFLFPFSEIQGFRNLLCIHVCTVEVCAVRAVSA